MAVKVPFTVVKPPDNFDRLSASVAVPEPAATSWSAN